MSSNMKKIWNIQTGVSQSGLQAAVQALENLQFTIFSILVENTTPTYTICAWKLGSATQAFA